MMDSQGKGKIAYMGLLLAFALILSYVESLIPFFFGIPGIKLGLANLAVLLTLVLFGAKEAFIMNLGRILISSFLFGNIAMLFYSMAGAVISFLILLFMKKTKKFSITGISMGGGVFHNIGQFFVAFFVVQTESVFYYLPILLTAGVGTGFLNGIIATAVKPYLVDKREERHG